MCVAFSHVNITTVTCLRQTIINTLKQWRREKGTQTHTHTHTHRHTHTLTHTDTHKDTHTHIHTHTHTHTKRMGRRREEVLQFKCSEDG